MTLAGAVRGAAGEPLACRALLIGNSRYRRNAALANPGRDVRLLAQALEPAGVRCELQFDLGRDALEAALQRFFSSVEVRGDAAWVSFSGHAVQIDGHNYLQGTDSDFSTPANVRQNGYDLDELVRRLTQARPRAAVVTVDACRNNPFRPEVTRGAAGLAPVETAGMFIGFSTAPYARALDGAEASYSPYAKALSEALRQRSRSLDAVFRDAADRVWRATGRQQAPEYRSSLRAEWWFGPSAIELRSPPVSSGGEALGATGAGALLRESSYRPDLPPEAVPATYSVTSAWDEDDRALQREITQMDRPAGARAVARGRSSQASAREQVLAGLLLASGAVVERDREQALARFRAAARRGDVLGQTLAGEASYALGDFAEAYKWLRLASDAGFARARLDLAQLKLEGRGTARDFAGAAELLKGILLPPNGVTQGAVQATPTPAELMRLFQGVAPTR